MKLWVRSQDKTKFSQVKICSYDYEENKHIVNCNGYPYGVYNSRERCLEIIDEIQSLFCDFLICKDVPPCDHQQFQKLGLTSIHYTGKDFTPEIEYHERSSVVYEMPKE